MLDFGYARDPPYLGSTQFAPEVRSGEPLIRCLSYYFPTLNAKKCGNTHAHKKKPNHSGMCGLRLLKELLLDGVMMSYIVSTIPAAAATPGPCNSVRQMSAMLAHVPGAIIKAALLLRNCR